jgi:selenocysteine lyase/cysteine desulfurase
VTATGVDYLAAGAHKWLLGMEGAGCLYVAPARASQLRPRLVSWLSHEDATRFLFAGAGHLRYDHKIRARADQFELGIVGSLSYAALHAAVGVLLELDVPAIYAHVQGLLDPLERGLCELGCTSRRSALADERSCILSVTPPTGVELPALWRALEARGVACASPDGHLRFSPHWYCSMAEVDFTLDAARAALRRGG